MRVKLSSLFKYQHASEGLPILGKDGYAGELDGTLPYKTSQLWFYSKKEADRQYPEGVPDYIKLHAGSYYKGAWTVILGWWARPGETFDDNPFYSSWA